MKVDEFRLLLCTNGYEASQPALEYGIWLAGLLRTPVMLLGVVEHPGSEMEVDGLLEETHSRLQVQGITCEVQVDRGRGSLVIARHAQENNYLTVVGPLGRPVWRRYLQGRSFRRMLSRIETPIIYVQETRLPLQRILLCMGGLGYAKSVAQLCIDLAHLVMAEITVFHVVEPMTLEYPLAKTVQEHLNDILNTDTPQGRNLRQAMEDIETAGVKAELRVHHGNPVHEILREVEKGAYDLIGLGSPYSAHSLRQMYMPNVTAEVAEAVGIPVLTVRLGKELAQD
jgi:nucleotide-binding universal stress UspA family protein